MKVSLERIGRGPAPGNSGPTHTRSSAAAAGYARSVRKKTGPALLTCLILCAAPLLRAQTQAPAAQADPVAAAATPVQTARNATVGTPTPAPPETVAPKPAAATPKKAAAGPEQKRYVIGPLDVLDIKVWGQNQLTGAVAVDRDGMLSLPLIDEIKADGMTTEQLKGTISTRLKACCLNDPQVEVSVAKINSKRYYVYGGVLKQGPYPLVEATTIMDALSEVGGFKDFANPKKITIQRGDQTFKFNYEDFKKGKNKDKNVNIELQNGDRIYVPE